MRRDSWGVWDGHIYTAAFKMDNQQGPTGQNRELDLCYVAAWMGVEFGKELNTCVCVAKALCYPPETITTLLINSTAI